MPPRDKAKYDEIIRMATNRVDNQTIAKETGTPVSTVRRYIREAKKAGTFKWKEGVEPKAKGKSLAKRVEHLELRISQLAEKGPVLEIFEYYDQEIKSINEKLLKFQRTSDDADDDDERLIETVKNLSRAVRFLRSAFFALLQDMIDHRHDINGEAILKSSRPLPEYGQHLKRELRADLRWRDVEDLVDQARTVAMTLATNPEDEIPKEVFETFLRAVSGDVDAIEEWKHFCQTKLGNGG